MDRIHAQSIRLSHLVTDLITISRLESSQREAEFSRINLTELIKRGFRVAEANSEEKNQTLSLNLGDEKIEVYGDNQNLSQLVDNLIDNAIKYTAEGGEIKLALFVEEEAAVFVVEDNGIGINSQYISRVFERFYRVDKARSQSLGGTGLGLSIVKNIAEKHGGSVSVQSLLGRGSTFTFKINRIIN
jgi:two-component system, OmpR family, phosphate regulon sensor histidine kinase PhoR